MAIPFYPFLTWLCHRKKEWRKEATTTPSGQRVGLGGGKSFPPRLPFLALAVPSKKEWRMKATATPLVNEWGWVVTAPSSSYPFLLLLSHREKGMEDGSHCHPSGQGVGLGDNFVPPSRSGAG